MSTAVAPRREANASDLVLQVQGLCKRYRLGGAAYGSLRDTLAFWSRRPVGTPASVIVALDDVSLSVAAGETVALIGANGAGKSTLLKVVARITPPDAGRAVVRGRVASLIELGAGFHPELTGTENAMLHGAMLGLRARETRAALDAIATFAGLRDRMDTPVKHFSTGMYARLGFSVAVHARPDLLLVDEVLSVGDEAFRAQGLARIQALRQQGTGVLFVSHDLAAVAQHADRVIHLAAGRVVAEGPPAPTIEAYRRAALETEETLPTGV